MTLVQFKKMIAEMPTPQLMRFARVLNAAVKIEIENMKEPSTKRQRSRAVSAFSKERRNIERLAVKALRAVI